MYSIVAFSCLLYWWPLLQAKAEEKTQEENLTELQLLSCQAGFLAPVCPEGQNRGLYVTTLARDRALQIMLASKENICNAPAENRMRASTMCKRDNTHLTSHVFLSFLEATKSCNIHYKADSENATHSVWTFDCTRKNTGDAWISQKIYQAENSSSDTLH